MTISSRTPEGDSATCPTCSASFVIEPSLFFGDAPCPHCGQLVWFSRRTDRIHTQTTDPEEYTNRLLDYLDRRGLRITRQRKTIARLIMAIPSPFASELLIDIARRLPHDHRLTRATVYRTLGEFVDAEMLSYTGDGWDRQYVRT